MRKYIILLSYLISIQLNAQIANLKDAPVNLKMDQAIQVLNVGTFHMGYSSDAHTVDFDEHNQENVRQIHEIAKKINLTSKEVLEQVVASSEYQTVDKLAKEKMNGRLTRALGG